MFQNLQTWHIIAIVLGILAVVGIVLYMKKDKKKDEKKDEKEKFKNLTNVITALSANNLIASSGQMVSENKPFERVEADLYADIGMTMCGKPLQMNREFAKKINNILTEAGGPETFTFIILFSDKLTDAQKKDFISALFLANMEKTRQGNPGSLSTVKLIGGKVECSGEYKMMFCGNNSEATLEEFANSLYDMATEVFIEDKFRQRMYDLTKQKGKQRIKMLDNGETVEEKSEYTELELQQIVEDKMRQFEARNLKLKKQLQDFSLCNLY